ncbi:hypothetical protein EZV62_004423 [Acer yangbiense]|uniref:Uncharacterized protein n=1 Tax=Acer yangbiense TaxID=1000413 RepID=A0A5C7IJX0_9ROSI|nr:hypothetical protein EZV62_004423 [Acer yangbiense]
MSKSCKGLALELVKCLSESDCVKVMILLKSDLTGNVLERNAHPYQANLLVLCDANLSGDKNNLGAMIKEFNCDAWNVLIFLSLFFNFQKLFSSTLSG